jgi:hypothetical protein
MDLWLPPKPAIILPAPEIKRPVKFWPAYLPGIAMPFAPASVATTPVSSAFRTSAVNSADQTTYTFTAQDIGAAAATRRVVVVVGASAGGAVTLSSATIGGVSATIHVNVNDFPHISIISAQVPTGTTGDVVVTFSAGVQDAGIGVYRMINEGSSSPFATASVSASTTPSVSIDVPTNGSLFAGSIVNSFFGANTFTWTGATERYDAVVETNNAYHSGASETGLSSQTGRTVSVALSAFNANGALAAMTWG